MQQINIRIENEEKMVLQLLAQSEGISIGELAKRVLLKEIANVRINFAFQLLHEGKISFKRCWNLSGLSYHEFLNEWSRRGAEEMISEEAYDKGLQLALNLDLNAFRKTTLDSAK